MHPVLVTALITTLFVVAHLGLASHPIRRRLVQRFGNTTFQLIYSGIAACLFMLWMNSVATQLSAGLGEAWLPFAISPWTRFLLMGAVVSGIVLMAASLAGYKRSPMALFRNQVNPARGIQRISRHGFFVGSVLFSGPHIVLANSSIASVMFAGLALLASIGLVMQDKKLTRYYGKPYRDYLRETSTIPFVAIIAGRQRLVLGELPWIGIAIGLAVAFGLRSVHVHIFDDGGAWVIGTVFVGIGGLLVQSLRRLFPTPTQTRHDETEKVGG